MAELCGNVAFRDHPGFLLSAHPDGNALRSREMQATRYAEGARTHSWMPKTPHIPFQTDEFGMCGNFDPPPPPHVTAVLPPGPPMGFNVTSTPSPRVLSRPG